MYEKFFHLKKRPFSIAPDPGFLYMSDRHSEALAHLKYGLESEGGFVLVTGEVGTGKTTLLRNIIGQVPGNVDVAFILNPRLTVRELLQTICDELAIDYPNQDQHSVKPYIDTLNKHLLETHQSNRSTVVVIDEAQNLSPAVLEQLRLLTNLETNERKLLRIILVGQPELRAMLDRQELRQLSQRVTARYHLAPLRLADTRAYLAHRLSVSGGNPNLFSNAASWNIHRKAGGIPRLINIIADRALLGAYADNKPRVDFMTSQKAARETLSDKKAMWRWLGVAGALLLAAGAGWWLLSNPTPNSNMQAGLTKPQPTQTQEHVSPAAQPALRDEGTPPAPEFSERNRTPEAPNRFEPDYVNEVSTQPETTTLKISTTNPAETIATTAVLPPKTSPNRSLQSLSATQRAQLPQPVPGVPFYRSQRRAFATMFELWGITYVATDTTVPCDYAPRYQLQCTKRVIDWDALQQLNIPVVMQLKGPNDQVFYATAITTRNNSVTLDQSGQQTVVPLESLKHVWTGTIIGLWPTPEIYRGSIKQGSNEQAVRELRELLGRAINRDLGNSRSFDAQLSRALQEFQSTNNLAQDGIAGPATWLLLHRAAGYDIPDLKG